MHLIVFIRLLLVALFFKCQVALLIFGILKWVDLDGDRLIVNIEHDRVVDGQVAWLLTFVSIYLRILVFKLLFYNPHIQVARRNCVSAVYFSAFCFQ